MGNLPTPEEYLSNHKRAFRVAFDFLNAHFPPGENPEWWDQAAKDVSAASAGAQEERLAVLLLAGVYEYLGDEWKKRRKTQDGQTDD